MAIEDEKSVLAGKDIPLEEALNKVGSGLYTAGLIIVTAMSLTAMGIELFGFSMAVTGCSCDFHLTVQQQGILSSLPFIGVILTSYMWGYIADTRGRLLVLKLSLYVSFCLSTLSSFSPNWIVLATVKLLSACFTCAANVASYTLLGESSPASVRSRNMLIISMPLMFSVAIATGMAYPLLKLTFAQELPWLGITFRSWRLLVIVLASPCFLSALCLHLFYESPKFLASRGRNEEALEILRKMFVSNGGSLEDFKVESIVLDEIRVRKNESHSLVRAIWEQSAVLFRPPLLGNTLKLFLIQFTLYCTNNGFVMWVPQIFGSLFDPVESGITDGLTLCDLLTSTPDTSMNSTVKVSTKCTGQITENTSYAVVFQGTFVLMLSMLAVRLHNRKKFTLILILICSSASAVVINLVSERISIVIFFSLFTGTAANMGIISSYFVELYPTSHRGTVAYLAMMIGRLSGFTGINIVGNFIFSHCNLTFYAWSAFLLGTVVVAFFLPADKSKENDNKKSVEAR